MLDGLLVIGVIACTCIVPSFDGVCGSSFVCVQHCCSYDDRGRLAQKRRAGWRKSGTFGGRIKKIVYELERKNEAYEDVEIDMSFARKYMDLKEDLRATEAEILERKKQKAQLEDEIRVCEGRKQALNERFMRRRLLSIRFRSFPEAM